MVQHRKQDEHWSPIVAKILQAASVLRGITHSTPVLTSRRLNQQLGTEIFLKAEMYQRTGSFKLRGAYYSMQKLRTEGAKAVVAHSSGNFAQAVALAGSLLGLKTTIVMPRSAPKIKIAATKNYGATIVECGDTSSERASIAKNLARTKGITLVEPYDDINVIAGQGTVAKELFDAAGHVDTLIVPLGGGGLLAGCAVFAKLVNPAMRVVGVEPAAMPKTARSLKSNAVVTVKVRPSILDGQRIATPGAITYPIISDLVDEVVTIKDGEALAAVKWLYEGLKIVAEPSGASALAAALGGKVSFGARTGIILSGGNISLDQLQTYLGNKKVLDSF